MAKTIKVTMKGISPLLMHAYPLVPIEALEKKTPEEQARLAAYIEPDSDPKRPRYYIPGINVQRALVSAANYSKGKGRSSLARQTAACVLVSPERILLQAKDYTIDVRPVVVPATKGRVPRYRPKFEAWAFTCEIEYDETLLKETELRKIVDDMGSRVGLLDFRPEKKGPFGRCIVTEWKS